MTKDNGVWGNGASNGVETKRNNAEKLRAEIECLRVNHIIDGKINHVSFKEHVDDIEDMFQRVELFNDDKNTLKDDLKLVRDEMREREEKEIKKPRMFKLEPEDLIPHKSIKVYDVVNSIDNDMVDMKRKNGQDVMMEIAKLGQDYVNDEKQDYQGFWLKSKEIVVMFKTLKLFVNDRDMAWTAYNQLCDKVRARQNERNNLKINASKRKREVVENIIKEVAFNIGEINIAEDKFEVLKARMEQALDLMKKDETIDYDKVVSDFSDDLASWKRIKMFKEDADICWDKWVIVRSKLNLAKNNDDGVNLEYCDRVQGIIDMIGKSNPSDILDTIKNVQSEMRQREDMFIGIKKDLRRVLNDLWTMTTTNSPVGADKNSNVNLEILDRMRKKKERLESLLVKNKQAVVRISSQLKDCHDRIAKTTEHEMLDKIKGWAVEKQDKIDDIIKTNKDIERELGEIAIKLESK